MGLLNGTRASYEARALVPTPILIGTVGVCVWRQYNRNVGYAPTLDAARSAPPFNMGRARIEIVRCRSLRHMQPSGKHQAASTHNPLVSRMCCKKL